MFKRKFHGMIYSFREIKKEAKKFRGWDYCEIYEALGLNCEPDVYSGLPYEEAEEAVLARLRRQIDICFQSLCWHFGSNKELPEGPKKIILTCRAYVYAAAHNKDSYNFKRPVWEGLSKVKHDEEFLRLFRILFPYIWD